MACPLSGLMIIGEPDELEFVNNGYTLSNYNGFNITCKDAKNGKITEHNMHLGLQPKLDTKFYFMLMAETVIIWSARLTGNELEPFAIFSIIFSPV